MIWADLPALLAVGVLVAAAVIDVVTFEIPDTLSIVLAVLAVAHGALHPGFGWAGHLSAAAAMFAFGLLAFSRGWLGGGDVKLMTALALWTGLAGLPVLFLAIALAGGALTLLILLIRRGLMLVRLPVGRLPAVLAPAAELPYAVAIAAGALWWAWAARIGPLAH